MQCTDQKSERTALKKGACLKGKKAERGWLVIVYPLLIGASLVLRTRRDYGCTFLLSMSKEESLGFVFIVGCSCADFLNRMEDRGPRFWLIAWEPLDNGCGAVLRQDASNSNSHYNDRLVTNRQDSTGGSGIARYRANCDVAFSIEA